MKKFTAILAAMILALFVVSCGDSKDNKDPEPTTEPTEEPTEEPTGEPTEEPTEEGCKLDNSILESDAERYFAYKGSGEIQDLDAINAGTARPVMASGVKTELVGVEDVEYNDVQQYSLFILTELAGATEDGEEVKIPSVAALALGYGAESTTQIVVAVPIEYIDYMKQYEEYVLDQAPLVQVIKFIESADGIYSQSCMMAGNKINGNAFVGKMQVCYDKNESFAIGEIFKLAMVAELSTQEEMVDYYTDVNSVEDLCSCVNMNEKDAKGDYLEVECGKVDWEGKCGGNAMLDEDGECKCNDGYVIKEGKCVKEAAEEEDPCKEAECGEDEVCKADKDAEKGYVCEKKEEALTCDAEAHKELNEAKDACVCMEGYVENETTHECEAK